MATKAAVNRRGEEEEEEAKTQKEGERILAPTRRPDGTLRKPVRIRAGYVPQDEVTVYKSKGALALLKKKETVPPGYDPEEDVVNKPKTKSAKRNERKKEKRLQGKNEVPSTEDSVVSQIKEITISEITSDDNVPDINKRIRALKKKIRLIEAQQQKMGTDLKPEQMDKVAKLEDWRVELNILEDRKASIKGD